MPNPSDIVRIRNVNDRPFRGKLSPTQWAVIPAPPDPRSEALFTFEQVCMWLGSPNIVNPKDRESRLTQLRTFYGVYDDRAAWDTDLPRLEVYDVLTNERVYMLLDDPDGTGGLISQVIPAGDAATQLILDRLAQSERETELLRAELTRFIGANAAMTPPATTAPALNPQGMVPGDGNASIYQAPAVTGVPFAPAAPTSPVQQVAGEGEAIVAPGLQPNGDLVMPNGAVIPKGGRPATALANVEIDPAVAAENRSGASARGGKRGEGGFKQVDPALMATATEDTPRAARV